MIIINLKERQFATNEPELNRLYAQLGVLLKVLQRRSIPDAVVHQINQHIEEINSSPLVGNDLKKLVKKHQTNILRIVEKQLKIVPKNYYTNVWMILGMSAFGLPIGVILGLSIGNLSMLAIGLPIGMGIGTGLGIYLDNKALAEGRQLDVEIK